MPPENPDYTLMARPDLAYQYQANLLKKGSVEELGPGVFKAHIHTIHHVSKPGIEIFDGMGKSIWDNTVPHRSYTTVTGFDCKNQSMRNFRRMYYDEEYPSEEALVRLHIYKQDRWDVMYAFLFKNLYNHFCKNHWGEFEEVEIIPPHWRDE